MWQRLYLHNFMPCCCDIYLGDDTVIKALGVGDINTVLCVDNITTHITLCGVLLAPDLKKHLILPDWLVEGSYVVMHNRCGCDVCHECTNECLLWVLHQSGMLVVPMHLCTPPTQVHATMEKQTVTMDELHCCMGHVGEARLCVIASKVVDIWVDWKLKLSLFLACIQAKAHRACIGQGPAPCACEPMHMIHLDVCGPFLVPLQGGACYFVTFIDQSA